mmetsp:Transcript_9783/g.17794  ORF Transcript_9783/g.17794 Transcript_9783/m.17794 type:complete len:1057 (-) Transcript_9783:261-3431(-)
MRVISSHSCGSTTTRVASAAVARLVGRSASSKVTAVGLAGSGHEERTCALWKSSPTEQMVRSTPYWHISHGQRSYSTLPMEHDGTIAMLQQHTSSDTMDVKAKDGISGVSLEERTDQLLHMDLRMDDKMVKQARKVIIAWAMHKGKPEMAERVLERLVAEEKRSISTEPMKTLVNPVLYNIVMGAWTKSHAPDIAKRTQDLFNRMEQRSIEYPMSAAKPDIISYNSLLTAYSKSTLDGATKKVEDLMALLESNHGTSGIAPDQVTYNIVLNTYANKVNEYGSAKKAEDLLLRMSSYKDKGGKLMVDATSFNRVLKAWVNSGEAGAPNRLHEILKLMMRLHNEGVPNIRPDNISFCTAIEAHTKITGGIQAAENAEVLLGLALSGAVESKHMTSIFNAVIKSWSRSGSPEAGQKAEHILQRMELLNQWGENVTKPNVISYTSCIEAYVKSGKHDSVQRGEDLLRRVIDMNLEGKLSVQPNTITFNNVLAAWAKSEKPEASQRTHDLFRLMEKLASEHQFDTLPDTSTYTLCIDVKCQKRNSGSILEAIYYLEEMEKSYLNGNTRAKPDNYSYHKIITGLLRTNNVKQVDEQAHRVLKLMKQQHLSGNLEVKPTSQAYSYVLACCQKAATKEAAARASHILIEMFDLEKAGDPNVSVTNGTYVTVMNAWGKSGHPDTAVIVMQIWNNLLRRHQEGTISTIPDAGMFETVLKGLSKTHNAWARHEATGIFGLMRKFNVEPTLQCYNHYLEILAKSEGTNVVPLAQAFLLRSVNDFKRGETKAMPNAIGFVAVIQAWMRTRDPNAVQEVNKLFEIMAEVSIDDNINSSLVIVYSTTIHALARSYRKDGAQLAQNLLEMLEKKESKETSRLLDRITYHSVIGGWASSTEGGIEKLHKARAVFDKLVRRSKNEKSQHFTPILETYNTLLNAAAFIYKGTPEECVEALAIVADLLQQLNSSDLEPDHVTYGTILKVYLKLVNDREKRFNMISELFSECCKSGQVGFFVMKEIQRLTEEERKMLLKESYDDPYTRARHFEILPREWTRNVKEHQKRENGNPRLV